MKNVLVKDVNTKNLYFFLILYYFILVLLSITWHLFSTSLDTQNALLSAKSTELCLKCLWTEWIWIDFKIVMINFMCQLDWFVGTQIFGETSFWYFCEGVWDEFSISADGLHKADCPP